MRGSRIEALGSIQPKDNDFAVKASESQGIVIRVIAPTYDCTGSKNS